MLEPATEYFLLLRTPAASSSDMCPFTTLGSGLKRLSVGDGGRDVAGEKTPTPASASFEKIDRSSCESSSASSSDMTASVLVCSPVSVSDGGVEGGVGVSSVSDAVWNRGEMGVSGGEETIMVGGSRGGSRERDLAPLRDLLRAGR